jgi:glycine reductase
MVPSRSVLYPTGDPELSRDEEYSLRMRIVQTALRALQTDIDAPRIFE